MSRKNKVSIKRTNKTRTKTFLELDIQTYVWYNKRKRMFDWDAGKSDMRGIAIEEGRCACTVGILQSCGQAYNLLRE